jgi:hypothetical protein
MQDGIKVSPGIPARHRGGAEKAQKVMALKSSSNLRATSDAGPISRILYGVAAADGHSSRPAIAGRLQRPTRRLGAPSRHALQTACAVSSSLPIWSCSVWGLPCPVHCCPGGALLPHLFTLTSSLRSRRYVFCGTFRRVSLNPPSRTLSGTLLYGVRTFLSLLARPGETPAFARRQRPSSPASAMPIIRWLWLQSGLYKCVPFLYRGKVFVTFTGSDCMMFRHFADWAFSHASICGGNDSNHSAFPPVTYNRRELNRADVESPS